MKSVAEWRNGFSYSLFTSATRSSYQNSGWQREHDVCHAFAYNRCSLVRCGRKDNDGDTDNFHDNGLCVPNADQKHYTSAKSIGDACEGDPPGGGNCPMLLSEWHIYGNAAQGRFATARPVGIGRMSPTGTTVAQPEEEFIRIIAEKVYEMNDHLGNVRVVLTDVKQPEAQSGQHPYRATLEATLKWKECSLWPALILASINMKHGDVALASN